MTSCGRPSSSGHQAAVLELDQHVVEVAVVLAVEEQHLLAAGRGPGDPDHLGVGARRRQRELPQRKAVAPRQLARDPDRVLGRQQVLRSRGATCRLTASTTGAGP